MATPLDAVEGFWLAQAMKHSLWLYPTVETLHLWGIALLFGSIALVDLRILGLAPGLGLGPLLRFAVPVALGGFGLAALTGLMMFIAHPAEFIDSSLFVLKMTLLFLLALNAGSLHVRLKPPGGQASPAPDGSAKIQALLSLVGWAAVIGLGRWLAYV